MTAYQGTARGCKKDCVNAVLEEKKIGEPNGPVEELTRALVECMLTGELNHHLGYEKHDVAG